MSSSILTRDTTLGGLRSELCSVEIVPQSEKMTFKFHRKIATWNRALDPVGNIRVPRLNGVAVPSLLIADQGKLRPISLCLPGQVPAEETCSVHDYGDLGIWPGLNPVPKPIYHQMRFPERQRHQGSPV
jgi:hypothetical protein